MYKTPLKDNTDCCFAQGAYRKEIDPKVGKSQSDFRHMFQ